MQSLNVFISLTRPLVIGVCVCVPVGPGGIASIKQLTSLHFFHTSATVIPEKNRRCYMGSNLGSVISDVKYEDWQSAWKLSLETKKSMYGPENRKPVGGRSDGQVFGDDLVDEEAEEDDDMGDEDRPKFKVPVVGGGRGSGSRSSAEVEPAFWFQMPMMFYTELMASYWAKQVIDCTPGSGNAALASLELQVAYLGISFNEAHRKLLTEHLADEVLQRMRDEQSTLYNPSYSKWYHETEGTTPAPGAPKRPPTGPGGPLPKPKPVPKKAGAPKPAPSPPPASASGGTPGTPAPVAGGGPASAPAGGQSLADLLANFD